MYCRLLALVCWFQNFQMSRTSQGTLTRSQLYEMERCKCWFFPDSIFFFRFFSLDPFLNKIWYFLQQKLNYLHNKISVARIIQVALEMAQFFFCKTLNVSYTHYKFIFRLKKLLLIGRPNISSAHTQESETVHLFPNRKLKHSFASCETQ